MAEQAQGRGRFLLVGQQAMQNLPDGTVFDFAAPDRQRCSKFFEAACGDWLCSRGVQVLLWADMPVEALNARGIPARDNGIDLASADFSTTVQAKWYAPGRYVNWSDCANFYALSKVAEAREMRLVASENVRVHALGQRLLFVHECIPAEFLAEFAAKAAAYVPVAAAVDTAPIVLRDYQRNAVEQILAGPRADHEIPRDLSSSESDADSVDVDDDAESCDSIRAIAHKSVFLSLACGTGKSVICAEACRRIFDARRDVAGPSTQAPTKVCVFVPSLLLLEQFAAVFARVARGLSVGLVSGTHDAEDVLENSCIICTYNSVQKVSGCHFSVVFVDEAHHAETAFVADSEAVYSHAIRELNAEKFVLMSATFSSLRFCDFAFSLRDAIDAGYLTDYRIVLGYHANGNIQHALAQTLVDHPEFSRVLAYCNSVQAAEEFAARVNAVAGRRIADGFSGETSLAIRRQKIAEFVAGTVRILVTVHTLSEGFDLPIADTCVFVEPRGSRINVNQCVGRVLRRDPHKQIAHVILPTTDEEAALSRFLQLMADADPVLARDLRAGASARPGRLWALSLTPVAETEQAVAEQLALTIYDRAGRLLAGETSWDRAYAAVADYVRENGKLPSSQAKIHAAGTDIGNWCARQRSSRAMLSADRREKLEALATAAGARVWYWELSDRWQAIYNAVATYAREQNRLPQPKTKVDCGLAGVIDIGHWCQTQRINRANLTDDQRAALEKLVDSTGKLVWFYEQDLDARWRAIYAAVLAYAREQNRPPPKGSKTRVNCGIAGVIDIGAWCQYQRTRRDKLSDDQRTALEKLVDSSGKPLWFYEQDLDARWRAIYTAVAAYAHEQNRLPFSNSKTKVDCGIAGVVDIGAWCNTQRTRRDKLSDDQRASLEKLVDNESKAVWIWSKKLAAPRQNPQLAQNWEAIYSAVLAYARVQNRLPPAGTKVDCGIAGVVDIGEWCRKQRTKRDKLTDDQRTTLEKLVDSSGNPVWFYEQDLDTRWRAIYEAVAAYAREQNRPPPQGTKADCGIAGRADVIDIGAWCRTQRIDRANLTDDQRAALEKLVDGAGNPVWFWELDLEARWRAIYAAVAAYAREQNRLPPAKTKVDCGIAGVIDIGMWYSNQRTNRGKLSDDRRVLLKALVDSAGKSLWV